MFSSPVVKLCLCFNFDISGKISKMTTKIMSSRGRELILYKGFKFAFQKNLERGRKRWICVMRKTHCHAHLRTGPDDTIIEHESMCTHNHEQSKNLERQIVNNYAKLAALENISKKPTEIIMKEVIKHNIDNINNKKQWQAFTKDDIRCVRKNISLARSRYRKSVAHTDDPQVKPDAKMSSVGFIGLGNMGAKMANHMIQKGSKLKIYDVMPEAVKSVTGATICKTPKEAATDVDVIFTMLPDGHIVKETVTGKNGIAEGIKSGALMIDCSTIEPKQARELSDIAKSKGFKFIDCPVSGGVTGAAAATLTYMIGGDKQDVEQARPFLMQAGAKIFHCGGPGAGQIAKLCNNLILGVTMAATAESFNMGIKAGLDPKVLTDIVNVSTGRSWSSETYNPVPGILPNVPSTNEYNGGFMVKLIAKDLGLAESAALQVNSPVPMTAAVHQIYRTMMNHGLGDKDFSVIYKFLEGKKP